jgi:hypothetical protein
VESLVTVKSTVSNHERRKIQWEVHRGGDAWTGMVEDATGEAVAGGRPRRVRGEKPITEGRWENAGWRLRAEQW